MLKGITLFVLTLFFGQASAECILQPEEVATGKYIGTFEANRITVSGISLSPKHGDLSKSSIFNLDTLYEIAGNSGSWRLRFADIYFRDGATHLGNGQWVNGKYPNNKGEYRIYALTTKQRIDGKTVTMVGDSITWWSAGKYFRCLLSAKIPYLRFVGPHTDAFGYGHAGEGGNKTVDVLSRLEKIRKSDYYLVHIGTNDWPIGDAKFSFENIKKISTELSRKGGKVIVMTILPRLDEHDERNKDVNSMLREWGGKGCNCSILDFENEFRSISDKRTLYWDKGLHPNLKGYERIVNIIYSKLIQETEG